MFSKKSQWIELAFSKENWSYAINPHKLSMIEKEDYKIIFRFETFSNTLTFEDLASCNEAYKLIKDELEIKI